MKGGFSQRHARQTARAHGYQTQRHTNCIPELIRSPPHTSPLNCSFAYFISSFLLDRNLTSPPESTKHPPHNNLGASKKHIITLQRAEHLIRIGRSTESISKLIHHHQIRVLIQLVHIAPEVLHEEMFMSDVNPVI